MNIFFDVDFTILSMDYTIRPYVREVFQRLIDEGHKIYIWSGVGLRTEVVRKFELESYVSGVFVKPLANYAQEIRRLRIQPTPDFCVDDHQEIIDALGGVRVKAFANWAGSVDEEMIRVYEEIQEFVRLRNETRQ